MRHLLKILIVAVAAAALVGCSRVDAVSVTTAAPSAPERVGIFAATEPSRPYVIVGFVSVMSRDPSELVRLARERAAALGANAIYGFRIDASESPWISCRAMAVRWS
jgi:hypothetical protein